MLTAKEIEEAREFLQKVCDGAWSLTEKGREKAVEVIDALCAQAHLTAEVAAEGDFAGHAADDFEVES